MFLAKVNIKHRSYVTCPQCRETIELPERPRTRLFVKNEQINETVINTVKRFTDEFCMENVTERKKIIIIKIFDHLYDNMEFVNKYLRHRNIIQNKLICFNNEGKLSDYPRNMYMKMFGVTIPSEYI
jgi:hypothetical protein